MEPKAAASESAPSTLGDASGSAVYVSRAACEHRRTVSLRAVRAA